MTFAEIREGEQFVWGNLTYMRIPEVKAPIGECDACGAGFNALTIGDRNGNQLKDRYGYPMLPWAVHFCPQEKVKAR